MRSRRGCAASIDDDLGVRPRTAPPNTEPEVHRHADDEGHVSVRQRLWARAREEQLVVRGHASAREAVEEHGDAQGLARPRQRLLRVAPVEVGPGHDHRAVRRRAAAPPARSSAERRRCLAEFHGRAAWPPGLRRLHEHVVDGKSTDVGAAWGAQRGREHVVDQAWDLRRALRGWAAAWSGGRTNGTWSISCREPCPQRRAGARPPSTTIGESFGLRRGHRAHPVRHAGSGGERADARLTRHLRPPLCGEGGGRLVAHVDRSMPSSRQPS